MRKDVGTLENLVINGRSVAVEEGPHFLMEEGQGKEEGSKFEEARHDALRDLVVEWLKDMNEKSGYTRQLL